MTCLPKGKVKIMCVVYQSSLWHRERNAKLSSDTLTEQHFDQHVFQKLGNCCVFSLTCVINCCAMDAYILSDGYSFIFKYWLSILLVLKKKKNYYLTSILTFLETKKRNSKWNYAYVHIFNSDKKQKTISILCWRFIYVDCMVLTFVEAVKVSAAFVSHDFWRKRFVQTKRNLQNMEPDFKS